MHHDGNVGEEAGGGDEDQPADHYYELAVVQKADYVHDPPAVVIVPADRALVLPGLVGSGRQGVLVCHGLRVVGQVGLQRNQRG